MTRKHNADNKIWRWLALLLIAVLAGSLVGCRGGGDDLQGAVVSLAVTPDPPLVGPTTVVVILSDAEGQPISGAEMSLEGNMNHPGMVPALATAAEVAPGRYQATLELTMGGDWYIVVQATLPDGRSLEHRVDVLGVDASAGTPGP
jgi:hypothetical protein